MTITEDKLDLDSTTEGVKVYAVGDTPDDYAYSSLNPDDWCGAADPTRSGFSCSIAAGHDGPQHVAANENRVVAVWDRVVLPPLVPSDAPDEVKQAVEKALAAYKQRVRDESFRVAKQQGWCDNGLNETLRNLDLPEKRTYHVWMSVPIPGTDTTVPVRVAVEDALSYDDAVQRVKDGKAAVPTHAVRDALYTALSATADKILAAADAADTSTLRVDGPDLTWDELEKARTSAARWTTRHRCEEYVTHPERGVMYCTRPRGHQNHGLEAHAAGNSTKINAVWTHDGTTATFIEEAPSAL